jgi:hypothetical protein
MKPTTYRLLPLIPLLFSSALAGSIADFGATTSLPDPVLSKQFNLPANTGFIVTDVFPDSPATKLGLAKDDLVTSLDGKPVSNIVSLAEVIAATHTPGQEVELTWSRAGQKSTAKVNLGDGCERADFVSRYQKRARRVGGLNFGQNGSVDEIVKNALGKLGQGGSGSAISAVADMMFTDGEHEISSTSGEGDKKKVKVTRVSDKKVVYEGEISEKELDQVPEEVREKVANVVRSGGVKVIEINPSTFGRTPGESQKADKPEHDVSDLLKKLEGSKGKAPESAGDK